jgi:hypothetical protein
MALAYTKAFFACGQLRNWLVALHPPVRLNKKEGYVMGKYLMLWEIDWTKVPVNPKERGAGWSLLLEMVKEDMKKGLTKDWGTFIGELGGYAVNEGSELEVANAVQRYTPFVRFKVHPIGSVSQVDEMIKALTK